MTRTSRVLCWLCVTLLLGSVSAGWAETPSKAAPKGKLISEGARKLGASFAEKAALEVARALAEALGLIKPNDNDADFNELKDQILTVAAGISWQNTLFHIDEQRGPATRALRNLKRDGTAMRGSNEDQDSGNASETLSVRDSAAFYRPYDPKVTQGRWNEAISYSKSELDVQTGDMVYDWRLGIPALLEVISYRLLVIAAINPDFRNDDSYDEELEHYRLSLQAHHDKMLAGIKCSKNVPKTTCLWWIFGCGTPLPSYDYACADIRTGIEAIEELPIPPRRSLPADLVFARLSSQVKRAMPLFEVKAMIDTLELYQGPKTDRTAIHEQVLPFFHQELCLDVQSGSSGSGAPMWLFPCNTAMGTQRWAYDRRSAVIRNPVFDQCLDVRGESAVAGTPVQTWGCHGGDSQRWTYSHHTRQLENALGTVLEIQRTRARRPWWALFRPRWSAIEAKTPVWTGPSTGSEVQQWLAEQP